MTGECSRLLSDLDDIRHAIGELLSSAEVTFVVGGLGTTAECLPVVLVRELDRVCDGLLGLSGAQARMDAECPA